MHRASAEGLTAMNEFLGKQPGWINGDYQLLDMFF
jgi:hypothetical protein